jgi:uncharacterized membrane protein YsdA (DUF1294 family)
MKTGNERLLKEKLKAIEDIITYEEKIRKIQSYKRNSIMGILHRGDVEYFNRKIKAKYEYIYQIDLLLNPKSSFIDRLNIDLYFLRDIFIIILFFVIIEVLWFYNFQKLNWLFFLIYLISSAICYVLYYTDKSISENNLKYYTNDFRIPEKYLHISEFFFGWPGALIAKHIVGHKKNRRSKSEYLQAVRMIILFHFLSWLLYFLSLRTAQNMMIEFLQYLLKNFNY